jgi:energy-coupling factor transporter transmembrane protein EcfT
MVTPSAPARLLCAAITIPGLFAVTQLPSIAIAAILTSALCLALPTVRGPHAKFVLWVWAPLALWMFVVWGLLVGAPPGSALQSSTIGGAVYAARISLRLLAIVGLLQSCLLSINSEQFAASLLSLRIPHHLALVVLNVFVLGPELRIRLDQVLTARIARGLMRRGSRVSSVQNIASTMVPLVAWGFRSAQARSDHWQQRGILSSPQLAASALSSSSDWIYVAASVCFTLGCVFRAFTE